MERNIYNVIEIEDEINLVVDRALVGDENTRIEAIKSWATTTFRNYVIREYIIQKWLYHSDNTAFTAAFTDQMPAIVSSAILSFFDGDDHHAERALLTKTLPSKCSRETYATLISTVIKNHFTSCDVLISNSDAPTWIRKDKLYGIVDVTSIASELEDLLDVMRSDWFTGYTDSLSKMSVDDVSQKHDSWIKWSTDRADSEEDFSGLRAVDIELSVEGLRVVELTTQVNLTREGKHMSNCVGSGKSYLNNINNGTRRIFSVRNSENMPSLTIEFDVETKMIIQIRGKRNRLVTLPELMMLRKFFLSLEALVNVPHAKQAQKPIAGGREEEDEDEEDEEEEEEEEEEGPSSRRV